MFRTMFCQRFFNGSLPGITARLRVSSGLRCCQWCWRGGLFIALRSIQIGYGGPQYLCNLPNRLLAGEGYSLHPVGYCALPCFQFLGQLGLCHSLSPHQFDEDFGKMFSRLHYLGCKA